MTCQRPERNPAFDKTTTRLLGGGAKGTARGRRSRRLNSLCAPASVTEDRPWFSRTSSRREPAAWAPVASTERAVGGSGTEVRRHREHVITAAPLAGGTFSSARSMGRQGEMMGWKHRQRKRMKQAAVSRDQRAARISGSSSGKWWLTIVTSATCCANPDCHGTLRVGREMVYRATPRAALCVPCADRAGLRYRPSARWEKARKTKRSSG